MASFLLSTGDYLILATGRERPEVVSASLPVSPVRKSEIPLLSGFSRPSLKFHILCILSFSFGFVSKRLANEKLALLPSFVASPGP